MISHSRVRAGSLLSTYRRSESVLHDGGDSRPTTPVGKAPAPGCTIQRPWESPLPCRNAIQCRSGDQVGADLGLGASNPTTLGVPPGCGATV